MSEVTSLLTRPPCQCSRFCLEDRLPGRDCRAWIPQQPLAFGYQGFVVVEGRHVNT